MANLIHVVLSSEFACPGQSHDPSVYTEKVPRTVTYQIYAQCSIDYYNKVVRKMALGFQFHTRIVARGNMRIKWLSESRTTRSDRMVRSGRDTDREVIGRDSGVLKPVLTIDVGWTGCRLFYRFAVPPWSESGTLSTYVGLYSTVQ